MRVGEGEGEGSQRGGKAVTERDATVVMSFFLFCCLARKHPGSVELTCHESHLIVKLNSKQWGDVATLTSLGPQAPR